ncbi:ATP-binding protein [Tersicoccus sp. MR15.9]|uniref:sensor histidine kinase n=1 Tax=Tersicoccus mangrovi TaxID=3121635 RepID=UPI002FE69E00
MLNRWKNASLRSQLVAMTSVLIAIVIALLGTLTVTTLKNTLVQRADSDLLNYTPSMSLYLYQVSQGSIEPSFNQLVFSRFYGLQMDAAGNIVTRTSRTSGTADVPQIPRMTVDQVRATPNGFNVQGSTRGSTGWRVLVRPLETGNGSVAIATPLNEVNEVVESAAWLILLLGVALVTLSSAVAYLAVTRAFRPLVKVERTAAAIAAGDLSRRLEPASPQTEMGRLSRSLNAMLAHIETAFAAQKASEAKMRRFVSDASHELRTPLVTIRGFSEFYRHGGLRTEEEVSTAMGRIESEATRMSELVEDLLVLARIDDARPARQRPFDLLLLGNDAAVDARVNAPGRRVTVTGLDGGSPRNAPVLGDESRLRQVVGNLMTNALRYTPEGSPIDIAVGTVETVGGAMDSVIEIRDHGPGISDADAARVFERFFRADTSRTRETGGSGLGLAIVAAIVAQHDGSVRLSETAGGGATFSVRLPFSAHDLAEELTATDGADVDPDASADAEASGSTATTATGRLRRALRRGVR